MKSKILILLSILMLSVFAMCTAYAMPNESDWYWISSDSKYSKFYAPDKVTADKFGDTAYKIVAWTRTDYAPEGAQETLTNYGITDISPLQLRYSLAQVEINPQNRMLSYINETFYDAEDKVLWHKDYNPVKPKEMNSQEFDEDFYAIIVDKIFGAGEVERRKAADRWLTLWNNTLEDGSNSSAMADTTTIRMKGDDVIFWKWQVQKNPDGNVKEIRFQKCTVNIKQGAGKINRYQHWDPVRQWQDYSKNVDGMYHGFSEGSEDAQALETLKTYIQNHPDWVYRYKLN